jgi:hypothetical protein
MIKGLKVFDSQVADIDADYWKHDGRIKSRIIHEVLGKHSLLSADYADECGFLDQGVRV